MIMEIKEKQVYRHQIWQTIKAVDNYNSPTTVQITLKKAKNDQFRKGHTIYIIWERLPTPSAQWMLWSSILLFKVAPQGHCFLIAKQPITHKSIIQLSP